MSEPKPPPDTSWLQTTEVHKGDQRRERATPGLFPVPETPPLRRAEGLRATTPSADRVVWSKYRPLRRIACDECVLVLHENHGVGAYPRSVRWRRKQGVDAVRLCEEHARQWRAEEC